MSTIPPQASTPGLLSAPQSLPPAPQEPGEPFPDPPTDLIETDGEPLESDWHRVAMNLLIDIVYYFWRGRNDFYAAGNMFIYFDRERARNRDFRGPDFFLVKGVTTRLRPYWAIWDEGGKYPDLIIELMSESTRIVDLTTKKDVYETVFRTPDYFCYDPTTKELVGWHLSNSRYEPIPPNAQGRLWCKSVGLWLGVWEGKVLERETVWLRFFDDQGNVVPTQSEAEQIRADAEKQRADTLEAELARLKAQLSAQAKP